MDSDAKSIQLLWFHLLRRRANNSETSSDPRGASGRMSDPSMRWRLSTAFLTSGSRSPVRPEKIRQLFPGHRAFLYDQKRQGSEWLSCRQQGLFHAGAPQFRLGEQLKVEFGVGHGHHRLSQQDMRKRYAFLLGPEKGRGISGKLFRLPNMGIHRQPSVNPRAPGWVGPIILPPQSRPDSRLEGD